MRIGILGGSFDPPHIGHLLAAQDALDELELDRLLIIPAASQPLKGAGHAPAVDRLAMVEACFSGLRRAEVDPVEIDRGGLSFMVDTVESVRRRWPVATLFLLIGEDVVGTLPQWRDVARLLSMVRLVVVNRADGRDSRESSVVPPESGIAASARRLATRRVDVSSTEIRARVRDGRSIRGFVPNDVETYIATTGLYIQNSRESSTTEGPAHA